MWVVVDRYSIVFGYDYDVFDVGVLLVWEIDFWFDGKCYVGN